MSELKLLDDVPSWLPTKLHSDAREFLQGAESPNSEDIIKKRLLLDPRMELIWKKLESIIDPEKRESSINDFYTFMPIFYEEVSARSFLPGELRALKELESKINKQIQNTLKLLKSINEFKKKESADILDEIKRLESSLKNYLIGKKNDDLEDYLFGEELTGLMKTQKRTGEKFIDSSLRKIAAALFKRYFDEPLDRQSSTVAMVMLGIDSSEIPKDTLRNRTRKVRSPQSKKSKT